MPADELLLTHKSWATDTYTYELGSLKRLGTWNETIESPLRALLEKLKLSHARIGYEAGPWVQPASYAAIASFGETFSRLIRACIPDATLIPADAALSRLRMIKTGAEINAIRASCAIAEQGFEDARKAIRVGETEMRIVARMRTVLMEGGPADQRSDGHAYCMSGPNSADAY